MYDPHGEPNGDIDYMNVSTFYFQIFKTWLLVLLNLKSSCVSGVRIEAMGTQQKPELMLATLQRRGHRAFPVRTQQ